MGKIFAYIAFGVEMAGLIPAIIALVKVPGPISATALLALLAPAIAELQTAFGVTIPSQLVSEIVTAVTDVLNTFHKKA